MSQCTGPGSGDSLHREADLCDECGMCQSDGEYRGCCGCPEVRWCWRYEDGTEAQAAWHDARHRQMLEARCQRFMEVFPDEYHWTEEREAPTTVDTQETMP